MADKETKKNWFKRHKIMTAILAVVGIAIIASAAGGDKTTTNKTASNTPTTNTAAATDTTATQPAATPEPKQPDVSPEYKSALSQAYTYSKTAHLSKAGLYDQLTSEYGGKFTAAAGQYAIDNAKIDYNANALAQGKQYQSQQSLSPSAIHDQLTSDYGGKFTAAEADYAVAHLND